MSLGVSFGPFQEGAADAHLAIADAIDRRAAAAATLCMEEHLDCGSRLMKEALLRAALGAWGPLTGIALADGTATSFDAPQIRQFVSLAPPWAKWIQHAARVVHFPERLGCDGEWDERVSGGPIPSA